MDGTNSSSISPRHLYGAIGTSGSPLVFDVRRNAGFDADDRMLVGALRWVPGEIGGRARDVPAGHSVVVYCQHGHEVSQEAAAALKASGIDARYLDGGIAGWAELGLPLRNKRVAAGGKWVTRERPKIDRIACPWLIRRFIEPEAGFLFAPTERVFAVAAEAGATAYDIPGPSRSRTTASCAALMPSSRSTSSPTRR
jgi:rhodanese-related sulfurtransferase